MANVLDDSHLNCGICLDLAEDAIETCCCHQLFCQSCLVGIDLCPMCRKVLNTTENHVIRRIIGKVPKPCDYCGDMVERSNLKSHQDICTERSIDCKFKHCTFTGSKNSILQHLITKHGNELTSPNYKIVHINETTVSSVAGQAFDLIGRKINTFGRTARLGETGKYYCGGDLDTNCRCCDGSCGPTNGCNCTPCFALDLASRNLPKGYFLNKVGSIVRKGEFWEGTVRYYCGRKVMPYSLPNGYQTDGWCGDDNGENCGYCRIIQSQLEFDGCYSDFVDK